MTAVEWLESEIKKIRNIIPKSLFEQAKQLEKDQIEVDIADAIYISKVSGKSTYEIIEQLKDRKWPKSK